LAKQAVFPGFARNELLEWAKSDNFYTALTALVALGGIEDTKTEAESQFKELFNTHVKEIPDAQSDEMLNRLFYDLESWRNTSAEIKQFATDFLVSRLGKFKNWQDSQVFFWIIALDPNQPKAWEFFNTQLEQAKPRDVSYALSLIGNGGSGSSLVLELLKQYAASGSTPYQTSATRALNMLRSLELTTAKN
jgi:hypothetical protein